MNGASPVTPVRLTRRGVWVVAVAATLAVLLLGWAVSSLFGSDGPHHRASHRPSGPTSSTPAYFLGASATGTRLYAEPHDVVGDGDARVLAALRELTTNHGPDDPDYTTVWPARAFRSASVDTTKIVVTLDDRATGHAAGVSPAQAVLGLQQVVRTAEAAAGNDGADLPVEFAGGDGTVLGMAVTGPVRRDDSFGLQAPVDLSSIAEGTDAHGSLTAGGSVSGEVTAVSWQLRGPKHHVLRSGTAHAEDGSWSTDQIDVSGLAPGDYVLVASARATGQTSAAPGTYSDTRTVHLT